MNFSMDKEYKTNIYNYDVGNSIFGIVQLKLLSLIFFQNRSGDGDMFLPKYSI